MEELVKQEEKKPERDERGRLLPGNTANPKGRPKGKTLKEYQAEQFRNMSDEDKEKFLKDIAKEIRWKMSEGNPQNATEHSGSLNISQVLDGLENE